MIDLHKQLIKMTITAAGDATQPIEIRSMVLNQPKSWGEIVSIPLNRWDVVRSLNSVPDILLKDENILFVPNTNNISKLNLRLLNDSIQEGTLTACEHTPLSEKIMPQQKQVSNLSSLNKSVQRQEVML